MKRCYRCKINKHISEFTKDKQRKSGLCEECKSCTKIRHKLYYESNKETHKRTKKVYYETNKDKILEKSRAYYHANKSECSRRAKEWRLKNPDSIKRARLKRYGITLEQYTDLVLKQEGLCKICGENKPLDIDHNHETGLIRGLLCGCCNKGIGQLKDNIELLENAIKYLKESVLSGQQY